MNVSVIGAGKMGLPLAAHMASRLLHVTACDINSDLVACVNRGESPIDEPGLPELIRGTVASGHLRATVDTAAAIATSDVVVVIVPAKIDETCHIDLSIMKAVTEQIAKSMKPGLLVSYETTVSVGTVRNEFVPILEKSGLRCGRDFQVCFSPERVKSRLVLERLGRTPKVVGGFDEACAQSGAAFYERALGAQILQVGTLEAAEFTKLVGMLYRDVNIALVNQVAAYAEVIGMDLEKIIEAANTDGEASLLTPGIGVGGHCAPVYPWFIIRDAERFGLDLTLARTAREVNLGQAEHVVQRLEAALGGLDGKRIIILGLAFRPEVKEQTMSPAFLLRDALGKRNAATFLHDPLFDADEIRENGFEPAQLLDAGGWDALILNTAHAAYSALDFVGLQARGLKVVVDGRNAWPKDSIQRCGITYLGIGR
jgi:nucleotide sugar dehydrogenase